MNKTNNQRHSDYAVMANHFHLILRSRPDVVATWDDTEVARRWLALCPVRKDADGNAEEPNEAELNSIRNDPQKLATTRLRLSDIAWWMRLLCQHIAVRANRDDQEVGKFWQSRFRAVRLLDEAAILACAAYVDLNPIRAAVAKTLESSDFTSVQRRIQSLPDPDEPSEKQNQKSAAATTASSSKTASRSKLSAKLSDNKPADRFLSPLTLRQRSNAKIGPNASKSGHRCSDKGFLAMSILDYVSLLDWTARQIAPGKRGRTPKEVPPEFQRLGFEPTIWCKLVLGFGQMFRAVAGRPTTVDSTRSRVHQHRFNLSSSARELLTTTD